MAKRLNVLARLSQGPYGPMGSGQVFDPEGSGYDMATAVRAGLKPDETGHWPSRDPTTGQLLKGRGHKTWHLTEDGERQAGYRIIEYNGRYYSVPIGSR